jgi:methionyl-tRNA formyltransferase
MRPGLTIAFAGTPELAATVLDKLMGDGTHSITCVYTQPDKPAGRGQKIHKSPVKLIAEHYQLPVIQPLTRDQLLEDRSLDHVDVLIVAAYGMILPEALLSRPRFGCINIHTSLLPRWRGAAPIQRAILAGDQQTGITIMQMDSGLDTGDILYQQTCPILATDTSGSLHDKMAVIGSECILTVLNRLQNGSLTPVQQDAVGITYANKIQKSEAEIDWDNPAAVIDRQIRAFNPAPVAYTTLNNQAMRIWQAQILDQPGYLSTPGTIVKYSPEGIDVSTTDKVIRIEKLQVPGKKTVGVRDFFNGNPGYWKH